MWELQSADEKLDWHQDWSDWIIPGDAITSSQWTINPDDATLSGATTDGNLTTVVVEGLTDGLSYQLKNTVTTQSGYIGTRETTIRCRAR